MTPSPADPKGLRAEIYAAIATGIRLDLPASEIAARVIAALDAATPREQEPCGECINCQNGHCAQCLSATPAREGEELRCIVTGNPCGTDTWMVGRPCQCEQCLRWLSDPSSSREGREALLEKLDAALAEMCAAVERLSRGKPGLRLSIPASPDHDTDLIICGALVAAREALAVWCVERDERAALLKLATEATNGWACHARTKREHGEISRLHEALRAVKFDAIRALLASSPASAPAAQREPKK